MTPTIFEYLPAHSVALFKLAEESVAADPTNIGPAIMPPAGSDVSTQPPPHPYKVGLKQLVPIALMGGLGTAAGYGTGKYLFKNKAKASKLSPELLGSIAGVSSGVGALGGSIMSQLQQADLAHAIQEYENYRSGTSPGGSPNPQIQPPVIRP